MDFLKIEAEGKNGPFAEEKLRSGWLHAYLLTPTTDPDLLDIQRNILNHARHVERASGFVVIVNPQDEIFLHAVLGKTDVDHVVVLATEDDEKLSKLAYACPHMKIVTGDPRDADILEGIKLLGRPDYLFIDANQYDDPNGLPDLTAALSAELMPREAGWCGQEKEFARWAIYGAEVGSSVSSLVHFFDEYAVPGVSNTAYVDLVKQIFWLNKEEIQAQEPELSSELRM